MSGEGGGSSPSVSGAPSCDSPVPSSEMIFREASSSKKMLSAEARPWYPPRSPSVSSQPIKEDDFPSYPADSTVSPSASVRSLSRRRDHGTPPHQIDEDDTIVYRVQLRDCEALTEEQVIRELVERGDLLTDGRHGFWGRDAPMAEGLHHVRTYYDDDGDGEGGDGTQQFPHHEGMMGFEEDFEDWEEDSDAYADSLDEEQIRWIESQLQAKTNPDDFFF